MKQDMPSGAATLTQVLVQLAELESAIDLHLHDAAQRGVSTLLLRSQQLAAELTALKERAGAITAILARRQGLPWSEFIASTAPSGHSCDGPEWARLAAPKLLRALVNASAAAGHAGRDKVVSQDLWDGMLAVREGSAATIVSVLFGDAAARDAVRRTEQEYGGRVPVSVQGPSQVIGSDAQIRAISEPALIMLDASTQVAQAWGHDFVGTEHLMLAMLDADPALWPERTNLPITRDALAEELGQMLAAIGLEIPKTDSQKEPHHE